LVADEWGEYITSAEAQSGCDAECFLSAAEKHATGDFAGAVKTRDSFFGGSCEEHEAEAPEKGFRGDFVSGERVLMHR
jgi:hypothetical protein